MKTVQEIHAEHASKAGEIMNAYLDSIGEIRERRDPEDGAYLDELTDEQRFALLQEQKASRANEAHAQTLEAYREEVERYQDKITQRRTHLKKRLFGVDGPDGAAALSRAVTATEKELATYLDVTGQAGNEDLARAVFVAAQCRGLRDLMHRVFGEMDQETGTLYQEWSRPPTEEVLERQRESVESVVQPPDFERLMPYAQAAT
jgi:hypothetical protein